MFYPYNFSLNRLCWCFFTRPRPCGCRMGPWGGLRAWLRYWSVWPAAEEAGAVWTWWIVWLHTIIIVDIIIIITIVIVIVIVIVTIVITIVIVSVIVAFSSSLSVCNPYPARCFFSPKPKDPYGRWIAASRHLDSDRLFHCGCCGFFVRESCWRKWRLAEDPLLMERLLIKILNLDDDNGCQIFCFTCFPTSQVSLLLAEQKKILHVSGEERNQRERLLNTQGEFLNPIVAQRMRAKNNPYRQTELTELGECLEDHPMTCKWLITMVTTSLLATY